MNWEAIGAVGEILSALGVIITLAYLALQIRQSNKVASWQTHQSSVTGFSRHASQIIVNEDVARIFREGLLHLEGLESNELIRFDYCLTDLMLMFKDTLDAYDKGLFDHPTYEAWEGYVASILNMPGGSVWWDENQSVFVPRVRKIVEKARKEVPRHDTILPTFWQSGFVGDDKPEQSDRATWSP